MRAKEQRRIKREMLERATQGGLTEGPVYHCEAVGRERMREAWEGRQRQRFYEPILFAFWELMQDALDYAAVLFILMVAVVAWLFMGTLLVFAFATSWMGFAFAVILSLLLYDAITRNPRRFAIGIVMAGLNVALLCVFFYRIS